MCKRRFYLERLTLVGSLGSMAVCTGAGTAELRTLRRAFFGHAPMHAAMRGVFTLQWHTVAQHGRFSTLLRTAASRKRARRKRARRKRARRRAHSEARGQARGAVGVDGESGSQRPRLPPVHVELRVVDDVAVVPAWPCPLTCRTAELRATGSGATSR